MFNSFLDLAVEIQRQDIKHGPFEGTMLGRSRLAIACLEDEINEVKEAWRNERQSDEWPETRQEILQVAAVAMRALRDWPTTSQSAPTKTSGMIPDPDPSEHAGEPDSTPPKPQDTE